MKYTIKQFPKKSFTNKMDMIRFMEKNKTELFALKMAEYKTKCEPVLKSGLFTGNSFEPFIEDITSDKMIVEAVINSTNVIDSHMDLHLAKTWNKTVSDNKTTPILESHNREFKSLIDKKGKQYNKQGSFQDVGLNVDFGTTFNISKFVVDRAKTPTMFDAYKNGDVTEHSVGMIYVKLDLAYYDESSEKNMEYFEAMKSQAINPEVAEEYGFVWVVSEAIKREGSPVIFGSNSITPTLSVKNYEPSQVDTNKEEPSENDTQEPTRKKGILLM